MKTEYEEWTKSDHYISQHGHNAPIEKDCKYCQRMIDGKEEIDFEDDE